MLTQNSKITILKEDNYFKWSNEIQIFLGQKNLKRCIEYDQLDEIPHSVSDLQIMYIMEKEDAEVNDKLTDDEKKIQSLFVSRNHTLPASNVCSVGVLSFRSVPG